MSGEKSHVSFADEALSSFADENPTELTSPEPKPSDRVFIDWDAMAKSTQSYEPPTMQPSPALCPYSTMPPPPTTQPAPNMPTRGSRTWKRLLSSASNSSQTLVFVASAITTICWAFILGMMVAAPTDKWDQRSNWDRFFRCFVLAWTSLSILLGTAQILVQGRHLPDPITRQLVIVLAAAVVLACLSLVVEIRRWYL
ncbi:uncharacterized protein BDZ99DRAFT_458882 [Mytilinidion resinicola]|uniref:Uncharacterized protein n=1 Tax=Mytilinidion resinicola TaxID=574789 RepID=A0A6A6Z2G8_9PEZI|nr:uncharacterized protein BDZ99DRAFT_458882 [Mytilinidion resinicola]KAF2814919.1 hypothetical protein BDZ99DRAFT_458882 [Mytilinidion resinicola]